MKIGILHRPGSFSDYWINYCKSNQIDYKVVDPFADDVINQLADYEAVMWHHHHSSAHDRIIAKQMLFALEQSGKKVFPNFRSGWHFDDKLAQKYLLEAIGAPLVKSFAFYNKTEALNWALKTTYPKVFKLRGGAGSSNVVLVHNKNEAQKLIKRVFGRGFKDKRLCERVSYQYQKYKDGRVSLKNFVNFVIIDIISHLSPSFVNNRETGYAYFQDFMPGNDHDIRVIVIGKRAFAIKRLCRDKDFRASGSGKIHYERSEIDERCVKLSFDVAKKLGSQCMGFDWVYDSNNNPLIVEMGYGFTASGYFNCAGYWTDDMQWHEGSNFDFCGWMVEDLLKNG